MSSLFPLYVGETKHGVSRKSTTIYNIVFIISTLCICLTCFRSDLNGMFLQLLDSKHLGEGEKRWPFIPRPPTLMTANGRLQIGEYDHVEIEK